MTANRRFPNHLDSVAAKLRGGSTYVLLSPFNEKTPKGEGEGYLTAMMYLAPHTLAGGKSLCPQSTAACRAGCLYSAGRGHTPRVEAARLRRTRLFLDQREDFFDQLVGELVSMQAVATKFGLKLAIRLNGTSDVLWERELLDGKTLFELFPDATFYDYTRTPPHHRRVPQNWRLTFSLADDPIEFAVGHLLAGRSVAAVVPDEAKRIWVGSWFMAGEHEVTVVDGDAHDLRFLDPVPALVLLKPKGKLLRGGPMVRQGLVDQLRRAAATGQERP